MTVSRLVSMFMSIFLPRIQEHGPVWSVRREDYVTSQPCPRPFHVPQDTTVLQGHRFHGPVLQSVFPVYSSFLSSTYYARPGPKAQMLIHLSIVDDIVVIL